MQPPYEVAAFLIRMVRDRTGVDNDYIALLTGGDTFVATLSVWNDTFFFICRVLLTMQK